MQQAQVTAKICYPSSLSTGPPAHELGFSFERFEGSQLDSSNLRSYSSPVRVKKCDQRGKQSGIISPGHTAEASSSSKPRYQFRKVSTVLEACRDQHGQTSNPSSFPSGSSSDSLSDSPPMSKFDYILSHRNHLLRSTASEKIQPLQDALDHNVTSDAEHARRKFSLLRFGRPTPSGEDDFSRKSQSSDFHLEPFTMSSKHLQPSLSSACHSTCSISDYSCQSNDSTEQLMLVRTPSLEDRLQCKGARDGTNTEPELLPWEWKMQTPASVKRSLSRSKISRSKNLFMSTNSVRASMESVSRPVQLDDEMEELSEANQTEPPKLKSSKSSSSLRKYFFELTGDSNSKTKTLRKKLSFSQHFSLKSSDSIKSQIQPYILDDQTEELSLTQFLTNETESMKSPAGKEPYIKQRFTNLSSSKLKEALHDPSPAPSPLKTKSRSGLFFWRRNQETEFSVLNPTPDKNKLKTLQISSPSAFRHINHNENRQCFEPFSRGSCERSDYEKTVAETNPSNSMLASSVSSYASTFHTIGTDTTNSRLLQPPSRPPRLRPIMSIPFTG